MFCVSLLLWWFCWVGPWAQNSDSKQCQCLFHGFWVKSKQLLLVWGLSFLWVYHDSEQHSLKEGVPCSCPPLITGSDCYTGLVERFLGLSWISVFVFLLVNQWTQTLQSRATFIRLDLLVLIFFQVSLMFSKSYSCASAKGVFPSHPKALPNPDGFNASKELITQCRSTQSCLASVRMTSSHWSCKSFD